MRKGIIVVIAVLLAAPAMGADWDFYGSARMATFWDHVDAGDARINGRKDDDDLVWDFQSNSVLGAKVKADKVKGQIELGLSSANTHDGGVAARRVWGGWKFADGAELVVGKDYTPIVQFVSGQVFDEDNGLAGIGTTDSRRPGQIRLELGDFKIAAVQPNSATAAPEFDGDADEYLPKLEASYTFKIGTFSLTPSAGFQYYRVEKTGASVTLTDDVDILSYILGLEFGAELGAAYVRAAGSFGRNWTNARWNDYGYTSDTNAGAALNGAGDDTEDCMSWQAALVLGYKFSDALTFEAGAGYRSDDNAAADHRDDAWSGYLQAVLSLAPNVFLVPEIGYFDYMKNAAGDDEGYEWYAGMKWQIDF